MKIAQKSIWNYTIVYYESVWGRRCAERIRDAIVRCVGIKLPMVTDSFETRECEILVGKTNRRESREARATYARPNLYYEISVKGSKLVCMGEGYCTLDKVASSFEALLGQNGDVELDGRLAAGDVCAETDCNMVDFTEGADLRVFNWNMSAPYLADANHVYEDNTERGEVIADIILRYFPDIVLTNEFYEGHWGGHLYTSVMRELSEYYDILDKSPYDEGKPYPNSKLIEGRTIPENVIYKKNADLSVERSGWRYLSELDRNGGHVYFHGTHTAVMKKGERRFIVSVGHYADCRANDIWAREHQSAIADMQALSGDAELPVIMTGDMFTFITYGERKDLAAGYLCHRDAGFTDSQLHADVNANGNQKHGTFHTIGVRQVDRCSEDFVWLRGGVRALKFKVLTSKEIDDASDHYPVMADIKFE